MNDLLTTATGAAGLLFAQPKWGEGARAAA